jgi:hypothetical protein
MYSIDDLDTFAEQNSEARPSPGAGGRALSRDAAAVSKSRT